MRTRVVIVAVAVLVMVGTLASAEPAGAAAVITVTTAADTLNPNDGLISLREATLLADVAGHSDTIVLAAGTFYALTFCGPVEGRAVNGALLLRLADTVTIEGNGATIEQKCPHGLPLLDDDAFVSSGPALSLRRLKIRGADSGFATRGGGSFSHTKLLDLHQTEITDSSGSCIDLSPTPIPFDISLDSSRLDGCGGRGILSGSQFGGRFEITGSEITGVKSVGGAEALALWGYQAVIVGSSIHHNEGGVTLQGLTTIAGSHFDHNRGPTAAFTASGLSATDSTFDDNEIVGEPMPGNTTAGVVAVGGAELKRVSVSRNRGPAAGLQLVGSFVPVPGLVVDSTVDGNVADLAGPSRHVAGIMGMPVSSSPITVSGTAVRGNVGHDSAGLYTTRATTVTGSTFAGNSVVGPDHDALPGTVVVDAAMLTMTGSSVHDNAVRTKGFNVSFGGVYAETGHVANSSIAGNTGDLGGVALQTGSLSHVTIADNIGPVANNLAVGDAKIAGSVVSSPVGASGRSCALANVSSTIASEGYNFFSDGSCPPSPGAPGDVVGGGDPKLGPLNAIGTISASRVPLPGSPLRDRIPVTATALCTGTDQRGVPRPQGGACDMGAVEAKGSRFHGLMPSRLLDSRLGAPGFPGQLHAGDPRSLTVTGGDVPTSASAVVLNVTVTGSTTNSFLNVWPAGMAPPTASSVNFAAGQTIPNLVTVAVGAGGQVTFATNQGATDVVVDVVGYFDDGTGAGDGWVGIDPVRAGDSRVVGSPFAGKVVAGTPRSLTVRGATVPGVPADASAVVANVTVTEGSAASFVTVWPAGEAQPVTSNLNFAVGETTANALVVRVGGYDSIRVANAVGDVHVVVDVVGYFAPATGGRFFPLPPTRVLDDRTGIGASGPWQTGQTRPVAVAGPLAAAVTGVAANVTVTNATAGSFVSVFPHATARPTSSTINFGPGQTKANQTMVRVVSGQVDIFNQLGTVDVIADVVGYYWAEPVSP
jgi:hypothetical protein